MKKNTWKIPFARPTPKLQDFLTQSLNLSRNQAKALIDRRGVFVNNRRIWMARHQLNPGDQVELTDGPEKTACRPPQVIHNEQGLLIVNKPAGITSNGVNSLETLLRRTLARPQLMALHRLDRDTTGCLMYSDDPVIREKIIALFKAGRIIKIYHAIITARPDFREREISMPLNGEKAVTRLRVLDAGPRGAHIQVSIDTGRTHQIRRHLTALQLPLLGDRQYATKRRLDNLEMSIPRQMLHARRLITPHPVTGKPLKLEAPLPADFRRALKSFQLR